MLRAASPPLPVSTTERAQTRKAARAGKEKFPPINLCHIANYWSFGRIQDLSRGPEPETTIDLGRQGLADCKFTNTSLALKRERK